MKAEGTMKYLLLSLFLLFGLFTKAQTPPSPPPAPAPEKKAEPPPAALPPKKEIIKENNKIEIPEATKAPAKKIEVKEEKDNLDFLDSIDYPELQVVPRASERLEQEAQFEREGGSWLNQWSFLGSGTATFLASSLSLSSTSNPSIDHQNLIKISQIIGATTLGVGVYYGLAKPYESAADRTRRVRGKDKRSMLLRERAAEEALERSANTIGTISSVSLWANLVSNVLLTGYGDTNAKTFAYGSTFISVLTMMFTHPYIVNWEKHKEYKHKIYTPLPQAAVFRDPKNGEIQSYWGLTWAF
jgi:hypothetical protein